MRVGTVPLASSYARPAQPVMRGEQKEAASFRLPTTPQPRQYTEETFTSFPASSLKGLEADQVGYKYEYAREAAAVSRAQGLPLGQYDFTQMSKAQMKSVLSDLVVNRGVPLDSFHIPDYMTRVIDDNGARLPDADTPRNMANILNQYIDFESRGGDSQTVARLQGAMEVMLRFQFDASRLYWR